MKNPISTAFIVINAIFWIAAPVVHAMPIDFGELSLLVRAGESETSIMQDVSQRKLLYPLTSQQEQTLRKQGASDSLVSALHNSSVAISKDDAAAIEAMRHQNAARVAAAAHHSEGEVEGSVSDISIFDVAVDHPVNLSQWGGPDYEFTFASHRCLGENVVVPSITNQAGTYTDVSRYVGFGADGWEFTPSGYYAVSERTMHRPIHIDMQNPVWVKGVPYVLYPIYSAGGVSLYYVSATTDSVKLAVGTRGR
jgi:hypothetical protein